MKETKTKANATQETKIEVVKTENEKALERYQNAIERGIKELPKFKNAGLRAQSERIVTIRVNSNGNNVELARVLGKVKSDKLYEDDDFKSVGDYAFKVFGIKVSSAYQLATIGERVFNNAKRDERLLDFPLTNLAELMRLSDDEIKKALDDGIIKFDMKQTELRDAVNAIKDAKSENGEDGNSKPSKVEKLFSGTIITVIAKTQTINVQPFESKSLKDVETLSENPFFLDDGAEVEHFTTTANEKSEPDENGKQKTLSKTIVKTTYNGSIIVHVNYREYVKAEPKPQPKAFTREYLESQLAELQKKLAEMGEA